MFHCVWFSCMLKFPVVYFWCFCESSSVHFSPVINYTLHERIYTWMQLITQHINVVSLPTQIYNSPTAVGPPPLELSMHVNEKPKFRTRVLAGSKIVLPLTSRVILITCCVAPSFSSKSVVWAKPWTEEQTNTQFVVNIEQGLVHYTQVH